MRVKEIVYPPLDMKYQNLLRSLLPRYYAGESKTGKCIARITVQDKGLPQNFREEDDDLGKAFTRCMAGVMEKFGSIIAQTPPAFVGRSVRAVRNRRARRRSIQNAFALAPNALHTLVRRGGVMKDNVHEERRKSLGSGSKTVEHDGFRTRAARHTGLEKEEDYEVGSGKKEEDYEVGSGNK